MRTLALLAVTLPLLAAAVSARAETAVAGTTQIYQQRTPDGRKLLTDRPDPLALTERSWLMTAEDPAAARQRALDVQRQAEAVSERVQRRIAEQERLAAADAQRSSMLAARRSRRDDAAAVRYDEGELSEPYPGYGAYGIPVIVSRPHGHGRRQLHDDERRQRQPAGRPGQGSRLRGSAAPESR